MHIGLGGLAGTFSDRSNAAMASATTQFQYPSLSTESGRCEKPSASFFVLDVAGLSDNWTSNPNLAYGPSKWYLVVMWGKKSPNTQIKKIITYCFVLVSAPFGSPLKTWLSYCHGRGGEGNNYVLCSCLCLKYVGDYTSNKYMLCNDGCLDELGPIIPQKWFFQKRVIS